MVDIVFIGPLVEITELPCQMTLIRFTVT